MFDALDFLRELKQEGDIGAFEFEFVRFILRKEPAATRILVNCAVLLSNGQKQGHICSDLSKLGSSQLAIKLGLTSLTPVQIKKELAKSKFVGKPGDYLPLVLEENRLYLQKYWEYETEFVEWLKKKASEKNEAISIDALDENLELLHKQQKAAVHLSVSKNLVIISGAPGTGKTYTVREIIKELVRLHSTARIALAAPTGKAAGRLKESLADDFSDLEPVTLHRLLGAKSSGEFRYNYHNKLNYDVVIVDEASMLDLRLWIGLIRAVKDDVKLILLGDKDQLASVEAGSVLGDICFNPANSADEDQSPQKNVLQENMVLLTQSYRSGTFSGINELAAAINTQKPDEVFRIANMFEGVEIKTPDTEMISKLLDGYAEQVAEGDYNTQILCSNRKGLLGSEQINAKVETKIKLHQGISDEDEWYPGRRILITKNDFSAGLSNGEIGTCYKAEDGQFLVLFGENKHIPILQVKHHEPAYAITVHKSQGSEFKDVVLLLPVAFNPVLSKELLYTSVTRARQSALIIGSEAILREAILNRVSRNSGISKKLLA